MLSYILVYFYFFLNSIPVFDIFLMELYDIHLLYQYIHLLIPLTLLQ